MDLGGATPSIDELKIDTGYTGTISFQNNFSVTGRLLMRNGTIDLNRFTFVLNGDKRTSFWRGGSVISSGGAMGLLSVFAGELDIAKYNGWGGPGPTLDHTYLLVNDGAQANWSHGDFTVRSGAWVSTAGTGTFVVTSSGVMGDAASNWVFANAGRVLKTGAGTATMRNVNYKDLGGGKTDIEEGELKRIAPPAPDSGGVVYEQDEGATLTVAAGATVVDDGDVQLSGDTTDQGQYTITGRDDELAGTVTLAGGTLEVDGGPAHVHHAATLVGDGGTVAGDVEDRGTVSVAGNGLSVTGNYTMNNETVGTLTYVSYTNVNGNTLSVSGDFDQAAARYGEAATFTSLAGGTLNVGGRVTLSDALDEVADFDLAGGTVSATEVVVGPSGKLEGAGTIAGDVVNDGVIQVSYYHGNSPPVGGVLTITGDYTQTGALELYVGQGTSDLLAVGGQATLGGALFVLKADSNLPNSAVLLSAGSIAGTFDSVQLLGLPGEVQYSDTAVTYVI